jgi:hypothetical protein
MFYNIINNKSSCNKINRCLSNNNNGNKSSKGIKTNI